MANDEPTLETPSRSVDPPDLQELVRQHGGYSNITQQAWVEWDQRITKWKSDLRSGVGYQLQRGGAAQ